MAVDDLHSIEGKLHEIEVSVCRRRPGRLLQLRRVVFQADNVFADKAEDRRMQFRVGKTPDLESIVFSHQFPGAGVLEITQLVDIFQVFALELVITVASVFILGKSRMRLVQDARPYVDFVNAVGDLVSRCGLRQFALRGVVVRRPRHFCCGQRRQLVRPLEVVILQRGHVDLRGKHRLVFGIGLHRIEMLGSLGKRRVEDILAGLLCRIRIVPWSAAAAEPSRQNQRHDCYQTFHPGEV